jgi:undecaprenyl-diphosphatase
MKRRSEAVSRTLERGLSWLYTQDLLLIAGFSLLAALLWIFVEIAQEIGDAETHALDRALLLALRSDAAGTDPIGPIWVERAALNLSAIGSGAVVTLLVLTVSGYLLLAARPRLALFLVTCSAGSGALVMLLKNVFQRPRPDVVVPILEASGLSFPSGHAVISAALYPTMGVILALAVQPLRLRLYVVSVAIAFALLVGATRVYLGVHYPTDVVAGWSIGFAWALLLGLLARILERRGAIDPEQEREAKRRPV